MTNFISNDQLQLAFDFVQYTDRNIFLTGKAGTGKTTFLQQLRKQSPKRMVVVAPTGVAAINAGGVTIHSFFQLPFGPFLPASIASVEGEEGDRSAETLQKFSKEKIKILRSLDLLVIDEISMVRADLLDGIDSVLRRYKNKYQPFGGVQLLMIGDLQQLSPVIKDEEWEILRPYYETGYFFSSRSLLQSSYISIELTHIFRQRDDTFIGLLNSIRENKADATTLQLLNQRYQPGFEPDERDGYITLTTHNHQANTLNSKKLNEIKKPSHRYEATVEGDFQEYLYPTDPVLELKMGAQVMFVKNDPSREKQYYNGKIGVITEMDHETVTVSCDGDDESIVVGQAVWENTRYKINDETKEITEEVIGTFSQIPLKLAWAITIHKSQGLTFEKAIIDAGAAFAHGQVYVALSRCKSLEGLVLTTPIVGNSIISDPRVQHFHHVIGNEQPDSNQLEQSKFEFQKKLLLELFDFRLMGSRFSYLQKGIMDHQESIHNTLSQSISLAKALFDSDVYSVSDRFRKQLLQMIAEKREISINEPLQERIQKGCDYFSSILEDKIFVPLQQLTIDIDNKSVKKTLSDSLSRLTEEIRMKILCLKGCNKGFEVSNYLDIRAKATLDNKEMQSKHRANQQEVRDLPEIYRILINWRKSTSEQLEMDPYKVMPQKVILELVSSLPETAKELSSIKGLGIKRKTQFGKELLELIKSYKKEKGLIVEKTIIEEDPFDMAELNHTKTATLELFKAGHSISQIAAKRNLSQSTIEGHLSHFIHLGELDVRTVLDEGKIKTIASWFTTHKSSSLKDAKDALGDQASYSELKFVLNSLRAPKEI